MDLLSRMLLTAGEAAEPVTGLAYIANTTAVATQTNSNTSITLTGIQSGDIVFFTWCADNNLTTNLESSWTTTEGSIWSAAPNGGGNIGTPGQKTYWKEATGTSITVDTGYTPTGSSGEYSMSLIAFRGLNTTTPLASIGFNSGLGTSLNIPGYTEGLANFNTYLFAVAGLDDDASVTLTPPGTYTKINQVASNDIGSVNATQSSAYSNYTAGTSRSGEQYTSSSNDSWNAFLWLLVVSGEETNPVISGSTDLSAAAGGTAVATYTADQTVTWSLQGSDASLFSISSGGVVTYNSASVLGRYFITVVATNGSGLIGKLNVVIDAYVSGGAAGGGITYVNAVSDEIIYTSTTTLTLTGLQSGDVVFWFAASAGNNNSFTESGSWSGWSSQLNPYILSTLYQPYMYYRWKVATGTSESVTLQVTSNSNNDQELASALVAFRGVDNSDPILLDPTPNISSIGGTDCFVPSEDMLADTVRLIIGGLDDDGGATSTPPSGYTEVVDINSDPSGGSNSGGATLTVAYKDVNGNTTEPVVNFTFTSGDSHYGNGIQLRPD
jgi:hypothetical protein